MKTIPFATLLVSFALLGCAQVNIADLDPNDFSGGDGGGGSKFEADVLPVFSTSCGACHIEEGALTGGLVLVPKASGSTLTTADLYNNVLVYVNTTTPEDSEILTVPSTGVLPSSGAHTGAVALASSTDGYKTVLSWIQAGAENN